MATNITPTTSNGGSRIALAIVAGLVVAGIVYAYMVRTNAAPNPTGTTPTAAVVYASTDIATGQTLEPSMLQIKNADQSQVPSGALVNISDAQGKVAVAHIAKGTAISQDLLTQSNADMGLAYMVPQDQRAVTVALDPVSSVAGFLKPGDHVDVIATFTQGTESVARTVLQDVMLIATGSKVTLTQQTQVISTSTAPNASNTPGSPEEIPNATLLVTPEQAQVLVLATSLGKIQLALRPKNDTIPVIVPALHSTAVTGFPIQNPAPVAAAAPALTQPVLAPFKPAPPAAPAPPAWNVVVIKGSQAQPVSVDK